jgi:FOG: WD40-like repeat
MKRLYQANDSFSGRLNIRKEALLSYRASVCRSLSLLGVLLCLVSSTAYSLPAGLLNATQVNLSQPLTVQWKYLSEQTINLTPATDGERIYLPLAGGAIVSLRASNGQLLWKTETGGELTASPVADERGVYLASESIGAEKGAQTPTGALRAVARESGVTLWLRSLPMPLQASLAINQDTIFGGARDGQIYAVRKRDGEILWNKQVAAPLASRLSLVGTRLYIGGEDGKLYALDQKTGRTLWRYQTRGAVRGNVAVGDGLVYFGSADGYVYALRETDGRLRWRARTGAGVQSVLSIRNSLLVASLDNFVYFLSAARGNRLWKRQLVGRLTAEPLATFDGALFTPLSGDSAVVLDLKNGKQLNSLPLGEDSNTAASPIIAGNILLMTTRHGLVAFSHPQDTTKK